MRQRDVTVTAQPDGKRRHIIYGQLTQLGECLLDVEKVSGSSPLLPTKRNLKRNTLCVNRFRFFFYRYIVTVVLSCQTARLFKHPPQCPKRLSRCKDIYFLLFIFRYNFDFRTWYF